VLARQEWDAIASRMVHLLNGASGVGAAAAAGAHGRDEASA
jgi:hypothetical protein